MEPVRRADAPEGGGRPAWSLPDELAAPVRYRLDGDADATCGDACDPSGVRVLGRARIDRAEALRYLGYAGQDIEPALAARIEEVFADAERTFVARGASRVFPVDAGGLDGQGLPCIRLSGTAVVLTGRSIFRHLKDARAAVVLAVTLGMESERALRAGAGRDALRAAVLDAGLSALVEAAAEAVDADAKRAAAPWGLTGNSRFSCGYGDCPLDAQPSLLDALDARRALGIALTPSALMIPSKSITAVFGLFEGDAAGQDASRTCRGCRLRAGCAFRARGARCWRA